ncbi:hypothetical protein GCM10011415_24120 [Salipiger pallidus]|uniref:Uncharacterized protein n=1 Tax=Salipiger pallidus TaxID=1775170 RepID=A0A8J2ZKA8_9RHOB|nr:hypothetical protein GCM10011415_24120 [Salipiger pallidus]
MSLDRQALPADTEVVLLSLRIHLAQLQAEAVRKQLPGDIVTRFAAYETVLTEDVPLLPLLEGPMTFLRGGVEDEYVTSALDSGFVAGWRHLCDLHDRLALRLGPDGFSGAETLTLRSEIAPAEIRCISQDAARAFDNLSVSDALRDTMSHLCDTIKRQTDLLADLRDRTPKRPSLLACSLKITGAIILGTLTCAASVAAIAQTASGAALLAALEPLAQKLLLLFA